jgi:hypothetical protein
MRRPTLAFGIVTTVLGVVALVPVTIAFLDELAMLRSEIEVYQVSHVGDFSDLTQKLEDISGPQFRDVRENDWFSAYVGSVASWGIVTGYKDAEGVPLGEFRPTNPVTVAEALKMVYKAAHVDETQCLRPPVHSKAATHWAKLFVSCAEERGMRLFQGAEVDLNRPVHRAELLGMLHDAFGDKVLPLFSSFKDTQGHRYEADIAYAVSRAIVSGDKDVSGNATGTFRPDANINRAEVAKILYTRLKVKVKEEARV